MKKIKTIIWYLLVFIIIGINAYYSDLYFSYFIDMPTIIIFLLVQVLFVTLICGWKRFWKALFGRKSSKEDLMLCRLFLCVTWMIGILLSSINAYSRIPGFINHVPDGMSIGTIVALVILPIIYAVIVTLLVLPRLIIGDELSEKVSSSENAKIEESNT